MLELAHLWLFLLLPLPILVWKFVPPRREIARAVRTPFFRNLVDSSGAEAREGAIIHRRTALQIVLMTIVWILLLTGLAKPQWVGEAIVKTESSRDIMLALDLSGSMDFADFPDEQGNNVRRFEAVQRVVDEFVSARESDRIGIIVFGNRAYLQLPFTRDLDTARKLVQLMDVGMAGPQTALGDAIGLSIKSFESSEVDQKLLVLLTDGNDTVSKMTPINAAEIAKLNDVEIFTIGVGDANADGEDRVDFVALQEVASRTGGEFFIAEDEGGLARIYEKIDTLVPGEIKSQSWRPRESLVHWPVGMATVIMLFWFLFTILDKFRNSHMVKRKMATR